MRTFRRNALNTLIAIALGMPDADADGAFLTVNMATVVGELKRILGKESGFESAALKVLPARPLPLLPRSSPPLPLTPRPPPSDERLPRPGL